MHAGRTWRGELKAGWSKQQKASTLSKHSGGTQFRAATATCTLPATVSHKFATLRSLALELFLQPTQMNSPSELLRLAPGLGL